MLLVGVSIGACPNNTTLFTAASTHSDLEHPDSLGGVLVEETDHEVVQVGIPVGRYLRADVQLELIHCMSAMRCDLLFRLDDLEQVDRVLKVEW